MSHSRLGSARYKLTVEENRIGTVADLPLSDSSKVLSARQRNLRHRALLVFVESHLHWLRDSFLRHNLSLHGCAFAMLHVLYRLNPVAPRLLTRYHSQVQLQPRSMGHSHKFFRIDLVHVVLRESNDGRFIVSRS